jgi:hypothetical protein
MQEHPPKKRGAPVRVWTPERKAELLAKLEDYIETTTLPVLAEFAFRERVNRQDLYAHPEFSDAIKRLMAKKEYILEMGALRGKFNASMAIFSLKQLGWTDKTKIEHSGTVKHEQTTKDPYEELAERLERLGVTVAANDSESD